MDIVNHSELRPGSEFEQWMDWSGQADATPGNPCIFAAGTANDKLSATVPQSYPISPSSPSTTINGEFPVFTSKTDTRAPYLPTPSHSSSSPEIPPLPELRRSGEIPREPSPMSQRRSLKRKFSPGEPLSVVPHTEDPRPANKKRPHNVIEKRYRANLNGKIAELADSVPSLRGFKRSTEQGPSKSGNEGEEEDLEGLTPANKLNKASILTKAVEYIRHLELRTKKLEDENLALKERLQTIDRVLAADGNASAKRASAFTSDTVIEQPPCPSDGGPEDEEARKARNPPGGLIPVPESIRRLRENLPKEHYGHIYEPSNLPRIGRGWPTKIMIGSLAGLMIMEGFAESNQGSASKEKGLFGIPLEFLDGYWFLRSPQLYLAAFLDYCHAGGMLPLIKGFTALTVLAFLIFAYLFNSRPRPQKPDPEPVKPQRVPSLASPLEVRQQAWLTSMQMLKLPHHNFIPEWMAVNSEWLRYTFRLILGQTTYAKITGHSTDDELARVKAWDIAIDAQLTGGDAESSRSRLVLSMFAAGTLPRTPARLMLKALHCRMLLRNTGRWDCLATRWTDKIAVRLADYQWRNAQHLLATRGTDSNEPLPPHLAALLQHDCDKVLLDAVIRRAFNLMYGRPTNEGADSSDSLMDVVVEDHATRSPLDAVAAWWSCRALRDALICSLKPDAVSQDAFMRHLRSALKVAPPGSAAHSRALAVHGVFCERQRVQFKEQVLAMLPDDGLDSASPGSTTPIPHFIDSSTPESAAPEILNILHCIDVMALLDDESLSPGPNHDLSKVFHLFSTLPLTTSNMSLLSFAPAYHVLERILCLTSDFPPTCSPVLQVLATWAHHKGVDTDALPEGSIKLLDDLFIDMDVSQQHERRQSMESNDTGYWSMADGEIV